MCGKHVPWENWAIDHYFLFSLFCAIPEEWRRLLKTNENAALLHAIVM